MTDLIHPTTDDEIWLRIGEEVRLNIAGEKMRGRAIVKHGQVGFEVSAEDEGYRQSASVYVREDSDDR